MRRELDESELQALKELSKQVLAMKEEGHLEWRGDFARLFGLAGTTQSVMLSVASRGNVPLSEQAASLQASIVFDANRVKFLGLFTQAEVTVPVMKPVGFSIVEQFQAAVEVNATAVQKAAVQAAMLPTGHSIQTAPMTVSQWNDNSRKRELTVITPSDIAGLTLARTVGASIGDPDTGAIAVDEFTPSLDAAGIVALRFELLESIPPSDATPVSGDIMFASANMVSSLKLRTFRDIDTGVFVTRPINQTEITKQTDVKYALTNLYDTARAIILDAGQDPNYFDPGTPMHKYGT